MNNPPNLILRTFCIIKNPKILEYVNVLPIGVCQKKKWAGPSESIGREKSYEQFCLDFFQICLHYLDFSRVKAWELVKEQKIRTTCGVAGRTPVFLCIYVFMYLQGWLE